VTNTPAPRSRLRGLDGLRFLAALAVLGYHYTGVSTRFWGAPPREVFPVINQVTRYGYLGVELFFMISGFVILMTAYSRPIEAFTASRIARLFPAYWVAVLLTLVLQAFWDGGRSLSISEALVNFTMIQEAFNITNAQGAFWTLWPELKFYLLIGVFILVGITRRRIIAFAVLWPLVAQIADATDTGMLVSLLIPSYAPYFALGMLLFLVYRDGGDVVLWMGIAFSWILCVWRATSYADQATQNVGAPVSSRVAAAVITLAAVAIWAVSAGPLRGVDWRPLTVLGALTYPLYLVHGQFGFATIDLLHETLPTYVVLALAVLVSLALAVALHYLVERKTHDRLRDAVLRALPPPRRREPAPDSRRREPAPDSRRREPAPDPA
jgi:peptidoglycan/LPS O-acetylase OafA/YrhL